MTSVIATVRESREKILGMTTFFLWSPIVSHIARLDERKRVWEWAPRSAGSMRSPGWENKMKDFAHQMRNKVVIYRLFLDKLISIYVEL